MSYDVSEQSAQHWSGRDPDDPPPGPRARRAGAPGASTPLGSYPGAQALPAEEPSGRVVPRVLSQRPPSGAFFTGAHPSGGYRTYGEAAGPEAATAAMYGCGGYPTYPAQPSAPSAYPAQPSAPSAYGRAPIEQYPVSALKPAASESLPGLPVREPIARSHDPAAADLRSQVVRRIRFMNFRHAEHAWERRHRDPIGPHALAFFYSEPPRGRPPRYTLRTATRLFLAGAEVDDLPQLLVELAKVVRKQRSGPYDARLLADRTEDMSSAAFYVGLGVSSLDTPAGTWARLRQRVVGAIDIPGRSYALLTDHTMLQLDRGGESQFGHFAVRASDSLDEVPGDSMQRWTYDRSLRELADPATRGVWQGMLELHNAIVGGAGDGQ